MLSVEPVLYVVSDVDLINDLVSIFLQRRREDHNLVVAGHCLDKLNTARSHEEEAVVLILKQRKEKVSEMSSRCFHATYLDIVNQRLVKIENQSIDFIFFFRLKWVKERWRHLGQVGKVVGEDSRTGGCNS